MYMHAYLLLSFGTFMMNLMTNTCSSVLILGYLWCEMEIESHLMSRLWFRNILTK